MDYKTLFDMFDKQEPNINDTAFYFKDDPKEIEHFIGFLPENDPPYWCGICDVEGGCAFNTAKELFEAPIYGGRSIKEKWDDLVLFQIGGIAIDDYNKLISGETTSKST